MEITWYGQGCFRMTERATLAVVTDPFDDSAGMEPPKLKADVVTISKTDNPKANNINAIVGAQRGDVRKITGPGEYEMGGVFITGVAMRPDKKSPEKTTVYAFNFDGLTVAHLGGLSFVPTQSQIDALETVNVLLVPVGGEGELSAAQASEVISMIEPSIVVPMSYGDKRTDALNKFLKEMGISSPKAQETLKLGKSQLPEDTQVVLLELKH